MPYLVALNRSHIEEMVSKREIIQSVYEDVDCMAMDRLCLIQRGAASGAIVSEVDITEQIIIPHSF